MYKNRYNRIVKETVIEAFTTYEQRRRLRYLQSNREGSMFCAKELLYHISTLSFELQFLEVIFISALPVVKIKGT